MSGPEILGLPSLVLDQNYSRAEAARSLGLNSNMLGRWVLEQRTDGGQALSK
jgi:transposase